MKQLEAVIQRGPLGLDGRRRNITVVFYDRVSMQHFTARGFLHMEEALAYASDVLDGLTAMRSVPFAWRKARAVEAAREARRNRPRTIRLSTQHIARPKRPSIPQGMKQAMRDAGLSDQQIAAVLAAYVEG